MRSTWLGALLVVPLVGGCVWVDFGSDGGDGQPPARYAAIDEERGSYGGVAIGDGRGAIFRSFGRSRPLGDSEPAIPKQAPIDVTLPYHIPFTVLYCYDDACFWFDTGKPHEAGDVGAPGIGQVEGFEITSPGATTLRGVEVGNDLDDAAELYPELRCGEIPPREPLIPGTPGDPYCYGRVAADRYLWLGGDPVDLIAVAGFDFGSS